MVLNVFIFFGDRVLLTWSFGIFRLNLPRTGITGVYHHSGSLCLFCLCSYTLTRMLLAGTSSMQGLSPSQSQKELCRDQECEPRQLPLLLSQTQQDSKNLCSRQDQWHHLFLRRSLQLTLLTNPSCLHKQPTQENQLKSLPVLFYPSLPGSEKRWYLRGEQGCQQ